LLEQKPVWLSHNRISQLVLSAIHAPAPNKICRNVEQKIQDADGMAKINTG
jgi:hypothetical protein